LRPDRSGSRATVELAEIVVACRRGHGRRKWVREKRKPLHFGCGKPKQAKKLAVRKEVLRPPHLGSKRRASGNDERAAKDGCERGVYQNRTPLLSARPP
jgi:hypothetical protein